MTFPVRWRGAREARSWHFAVALLVAVVIHLPLTPLAFLWNLFGMAFHRSDDWDYHDDTVVVPISLELDSPGGRAEPAPGAAPPATGPAATTVGQEATRGVADAGVRDAAVPDAGRRRLHRDAGPHVDGAVTAVTGDAGPGDGGGGVAGREPKDGGGGIASAADGSANEVRDPLGLAGALDKVTKGKPNIMLALWLSELRTHPLGPSFANILTCSPQWRDFLGEGVVDPLRDLDAVQLSGPQFVDSSKVTAVVATHLDKAQIRAIVGGLVARSGGAGGFLGDAGVGEIVARFHADRADRIVVTHPRDLVFVTPPEGYEQIARHHGALSMPPSKGRAGALTLVAPWRPLRRLGLALPQTLTEMRLEAMPAADGGVDLHIECDDTDEATAALDAPAVQAELGGFALLTGEIPVRADGPRVTAQFHLSGFATSILLGMAEAQVCPNRDAGQR